jgi:hypothetical protein
MTAMVLSIIMAEAQETFIMKKIAGYAHCNCFRVAIKILVSKLFMLLHKFLIQHS